MRPAAGRIITMCLTGGPSGGKTTALLFLQRTLGSIGLDTYTVPEVPTLIKQAGHPYPGTAPGREQWLQQFERQLFALQHSFENSSRLLAEERSRDRQGRPAVIICDRGLLDIAAYMPDSMFFPLAKEFGFLNRQQILARYDCVLHFDTPAVAPWSRGKYTQANNAARTEDAETAVMLDSMVKKAWEQHPSFQVVPNPMPPKGFTDKLEEASQIALGRVQELLMEDKEKGSSTSAAAGVAGSKVQ